LYENEIAEEGTTNDRDIAGADGTDKALHIAGTSKAVGPEAELQEQASVQSETGALNDKQKKDAAGVLNHLDTVSAPAHDLHVPVIRLGSIARLVETVDVSPDNYSGHQAPQTDGDHVHTPCT